MKKQRIIGVLFVIISILLVLLASQGTTVEERDVTAVLFTLPLGIYLIFTKIYCLHSIEPERIRAKSYPPDTYNCRCVIIPHFPSDGKQPSSEL